MTTYLTSDLHIGHQVQAWYREHGWFPADTDEVTPEVVRNHDAMLAANWDVAVRKDDVVWVLGDLTANNRVLEYALDWVQARPGTKHLVLGNHDPAHPMHSDSQKWEHRYHRVFDSMGTTRTRKMTLRDGTSHRVLLSHFPYQGDSQTREDRDVQFRLRDEGRPLLHGHTHSPHQVTRTVANTPQFHVGVDARDYFPVSLDQVVDLLSDEVGALG